MAFLLHKMTHNITFCSLLHFGRYIL